MALSWASDNSPPPHPLSPAEDALAACLLRALATTTCSRTDLYESRNVARGAIRKRRRERGLWRHLVWRPWPCECGWWHAGPRGDRAV